MNTLPILTFSLPWFHSKTTNKGAKFETLNCFCLYFSHCHVKGLPSKHVALKVDARGAENILFPGASMHPSARTFYRLDSEGVK